jgi:hypothetical protein
MTKLPWWRADASEMMAVTAMGVWEAVLAGGGRRFIKRKDSDAGETGSHPHHPPCLFLLLVNIFQKKKNLSAAGRLFGFDAKEALFLGSARLVFVACSAVGANSVSRSFFSAFEEIF